MKELREYAIEAMKRAYAPYSGYQVGAALRCTDGTVYTGCNIENASYGATNCAERCAFFKAVSEGKRTFTDIAICGGKDGAITGVFPPCGICRQVMREFCTDDFEIHLIRSDGEVTYRLDELLPVSFAPEHIQGGGNDESISDSE